ncbi:MAG: hypothetical protein ACOC2H_02170 [Spirochaetota bacterium]
MILYDILFAILIALLLAVLFSRSGRTGPWMWPWGGLWAGFITFFLVIFLASWAGGLWMTPFGPVLFGVYWLPFLLVGTFVALILGAHPKQPPRTRSEAVQQARDEQAAERTIDIFFWGIILILVISIIVGYFY